jgi:hypothetical protein
MSELLQALPLCWFTPALPSYRSIHCALLWEPNLSQTGHTLECGAMQTPLCQTERIIKIQY